jgi:hypothetical protein
MQSNSLSSIQSGVLFLLLATLLLATLQFHNQAKLHRNTPNSQQRQICFAGSSLILAMITFRIGLFGLCPGGERLSPKEWLEGNLLLLFCAAITFLFTHAAMITIVIASLQRYYRLCAVAIGTSHEKLFLAAQYGSYIASATAFSSNIIGSFFFRHPFVGAIYTVALMWLMIVDFYANYSVSNTILIAR